MRYKFWNFVHDRLEKAWHWVYYHKLAVHPPTASGGWQYGYTYFNSKTGTASGVSPLSDTIEVWRDEK